MKKILSLIILLTSSVLAGEISLEIGDYATGYNYFQKPNKDSNRQDMPQEAGNFYYRIRTFYDLKNDWMVYGLLAPLTIDYSYDSDKNFVYNNQSFLKGKTDVSYKFNSYRLGMLKKFIYENYSWWGGATLKVRDAHIIVKQGAKEEKFSNIGLVPLLSIGGEWYFTEHIGVWSHFDGLAASQGSAYDLSLELRFRVNNNHFFSIGKRILGGGADNDELKNFALFESNYMNFVYSF